MRGRGAPRGVRGMAMAVRGGRGRGAPGGRTLFDSDSSSGSGSDSEEEYEEHKKVSI